MRQEETHFMVRVAWVGQSNQICWNGFFLHFFFIYLNKYNLLFVCNKLNTYVSVLPQHWIKDLFMVQCFMELSLSEEAITIYTVFCNKGFSKSIYIKSQMAKCYDNLRESQLSKQTFEEIRKLDPFNLW